ncbi:hypothetical protein FEV13_00135 (plasmid) [Stutzerimonas degradans]|nr:hypothetical protein FEV13_00135 [Stutzerimonas degradans]
MGGRITVESVVRCSWNGWPDDREIRSRSPGEAGEMASGYGQARRTQAARAASSLNAGVFSSGQPCPMWPWYRHLPAQRLPRR